MTPLLLALLLGQVSDPVGWVVIPQLTTSWTKLQAAIAPWQMASEAVPKDADSLVMTFDRAGNRQMLTTPAAQAPYTSDPATAQAARLTANADVELVLSTSRLLKSIGAESSGVSLLRAAQRLSLDKVQNVVASLTVVDMKHAHLDALAAYPPPRSGFVEALGPPVPGALPAWVPKDALSVDCISVIPSAVFNQANLAFAAADPIEQVLFFTHLRGLESQLGKHFADDGLGSTPRLWTIYLRASDAVGVLEVADAALVKQFLDSYAAAATALLPGTKVERGKVGTHETLSVTLPNRRVFAIGFDKTSIVVAENAKALQAHFTNKARGKLPAVAASAIAYGTATHDGGKSAAWSMNLTDAGLRLTGDVKAKK